MSKWEIYQLLHAEVIRTLEAMGQYRLALEVERLGPSHPIYDDLDKAFSLYYAEYGGTNCRWLSDAIKRDWPNVVKVVLPSILRQILQKNPRYAQEKKRNAQTLETFKRHK